MRKILFVCEGNVGRSQMAEGFYNTLVLPDGAISAGIGDVGEKYNYQPTREVIEVMVEEGIDIAGQKVKQFTLEMARNKRKIIVLCKKDYCPKFLLQNRNILFFEVEDPCAADIDLLRRIRDKIKIFVLNFEMR